MMLPRSTQNRSPLELPCLLALAGDAFLELELVRIDSEGVGECPTLY